MPVWRSGRNEPFSTVDLCYDAFITLNYSHIYINTNLLVFDTHLLLEHF